MWHISVVVGCSLLLYGIALCLPCLLFNVVPQSGREIVGFNVHGNPFNTVSINGFELTIAGIFGLLLCLIPPALAWLANPMYWLCCVFFVHQQYKSALIVALIAVIVGYTGTVSAFLFRLPNGSSSLTRLALEKLLPGFWVWLAAPGLVALISAFKLVQMR